MKIATLCSYGRQLCPKRTTSKKVLSSALVVSGKVNILLQLVRGSSVLRGLGTSGYLRHLPSRQAAVGVESGVLFFQLGTQHNRSRNLIFFSLT